MNALTLFRKNPWMITLVVLVILIVVNAILQPSFTSPRAIRSNLSTFLPLVLVAIGQTYVILSGDIDLSVGSTVALSNVVTVTVIASLGGTDIAILTGIAAGILVGLACGLFNGLLIAKLRLQPIVTTFATGILFAALAIWVLPTAGLAVPSNYWRTYGGLVLGVPTVAWVLLIGVAFALIFGRTVAHAQILAVGGNRTGAFQSGLPLDRIRIGSYMLAGLFASLAALCLTGETASGDPLLGQALALSSISAVVLGGTALAGGFGSAIGSVLGALVLGMIGNVIFFAGLPFEYQTLVQGLIVLLALAGGVLVTRR
ncbi:ABC transporter permease [Ketogulonicigenium vulgare]|uniref:ABC transporter permease n=1 Tax=Ketogulonicigenium vulgare TaxID=92945 RepID=UPI0001E68047|nr:ABC transporter permease [Ketogulonicigenium vulgare]ADO41621.1 ABC transporter, membrane spanning protein (sugar) [Ketogulonicigenium vulgare Y25]ALJ80077.1 sugar ABC transporter permease [Ketogulonicigenium vulgare]ANW32953.1 sugar ABC transporter permease [Ketogulonicigenium vulgare]AOZ53552.1 sugar ABC transporter transmembrane protein [Ketogulonicigenium vulgare]